jgi:glycosyltransferase involved in cell wall biosynthesis
MRKIIFCGPFGKAGRFVGGGESGNLKTLKLLNNAGYDVKLVEKPYPKGNKLIKPALYVIQILGYIFRYIYALLKTSKESTVHITGFYGHLIYLEWIFVTIGKLFSRKVIYELRAGGAHDFYSVGSRLYRLFFEKTILKADVILCQGKEYQTFLKEHFNKSSVYYPNYMESTSFEKFTSKILHVNKYDVIKLVYFGRLVSSKNVENVLEIASLIENGGAEVELCLIGPCADDYQKVLEKRVNSLKLVGNVEFSGKQPSAQLFAVLENSHFFVFPTKEKREGHSNSLTEAMACGVVPIVSDCGFNRSVVGNDEFVVNGVDSKLFAEKILSIWQQESWRDLSKMVRKRVKDNYLDIVVKDDLLKAHSKLTRI